MATFPENSWHFIHRSLFKAFLKTALMILVCYGCTTAGHPERFQDAGFSIRGPDDLARLERDLEQLLGYCDEEVPRLAKALLESSESLAREYRVEPPALWHNFMVNLGLRDRGLCCHWTQDLLQRVDALQLRNFQALWGVSRYGTLREHSSLIIIAAGQGFEDGLVLDPWRNAGRLYWGQVTDDTYVWQPHPGSHGTARIRCR